MIEMGWYMDTGGWRTAAAPGPYFPPYSGGGTAVANIFPGLMNYAHTGWTDNDYPEAV